MDLISTPEERKKQQEERAVLDERLSILVTEKGSLLVKMLFAMNGSGLIATLALIAQVYSSNKELASSISAPTISFLLGVLSVWLTLFVELCMNVLQSVNAGPVMALAKKLESWIRYVSLVGALLMFCSLAAFITGAIWAAKILTTL